MNFREISGPTIVVGLTPSLPNSYNENFVELATGKLLMVGIGETASYTFQDALVSQILSNDRTSASQPLTIYQPSIGEMNEIVGIHTELLSSGKIVTTWLDYQYGVAASFAKYAVVNSAGSAVEFVREMVTPDGYTFLNFVAKSLSNGNTIFIWEQRNNSNGDTRVMAQFIDANGNLLATPIEIADEGQNIIGTGTRPPAIAALPGGAFAVSWQYFGLNGNTLGHEIHTRVFNSNGTPLTAAREVQDGNGFYLGAATAELDNGRYVVLWESIQNEHTIHGVIVNSNGTVASEFDIDAKQEGLLSSTLAVSQLASGRFVVTWGQSTEYVYGARLSQIFEADGSKFSEVFTVLRPQEFNEVDRNVTSAPTLLFEELPEDQLSILQTHYTSTGTTVYKSIVYMQDFVGIGYSDFWRGTQFANYTVAGGGADELFGEGGNDTIFGEAGDDFIVGGIGADTLDGGDGRDTLSYFGETAAVVALDGSVNNSGSATGDVVRGFEIVEGSNNGADNIIGNEQDNELRGYGGGDRTRWKSGKRSTHRWGWC